MGVRLAAGRSLEGEVGGGGERWSVQMVEGVGEVQRPGQDGTEGQVVGWAREGRGPQHT